MTSIPKEADSATAVKRAFWGKQIAVWEHSGRADNPLRSDLHKIKA